jgi:hypothetical protein
MLKHLAMAVTALVLSAPAVAQVTFPAQGAASPTTAAPAQSATSSKGALICEYQDDTGSRVNRKKLCYTADEWQRIKAESRESIEKYQQQTKGPSSG